MELTDNWRSTIYVEIIWTKQHQPDNVASLSEESTLYSLLKRVKASEGFEEVSTHNQSSMAGHTSFETS